ncbi:MAG TPA: cell division ATP-binding protein FtsE [bacterium]|nr:cell division ATP-binding protein FtsE [bacterium]
MIEFRNVTKIYEPNVHALNHATFHIKPGEFVFLVGQSGTGKTTAVRLLISEEKVSNGRIIVGGWDITHIRRKHIPLLRRQIGVVWQDYKLLPKKTVFENVAFALEVSGAEKERIQKIVPQVLKIVGLQDKTNRYPTQLSGGEQQRVSIARSLVHRPKILVADEPTGNLDTVNTREIIDILQKINEFGTTVLLVTHNREIVNSLKKRVITLEKGLVISDQEKGRYML